MPGTTYYPTAKDSHTGADPFGFQPITDLLATTLLSGVSAMATTLPITSTSGWNARGFAIIRSANPDSLALPEIVTYTSTPTQQLAGVTRGVGTVAKEWPAGSIVELNPVSRHHNDLAAAIVAMQQTAVCDLYDTTTQSIPDITLTNLTWDTEQSDAQAMHTGSSADITVVQPGIYRALGQLQWDSNTVGARWHFIGVSPHPPAVYAGYKYISSAAVAASRTVQVITAPIRCAAGVTWRFGVYQNSGGARTITKVQNAGRFALYRMGGLT